MPYNTKFIFTYDSGEFERNMDDALALARLERLRRSASRTPRSAASCAASASPMRSRFRPGLRRRRCRKAPRSSSIPTGAVTLTMGTHSHGQGHEITFAQIVADMLGHRAGRHPRALWRYRLVEFGTGTFGSRSIITGSEFAAHLRRSPDRARQEDRGGAFRGRGAGYRVRGRAILDCRHRPPHRHQGRGEAVLYAARSKPRRRVRFFGQDGGRAEGRDLPERLPCLRGRDRSRYRDLHALSAMSWSTMSGGSSIRCWSRARCMAAWCRGSARSCSRISAMTRTASS